MKKILLSICFLFAAITFVSAQRAAERKAQIKQGLKEEVKLTDDQIVSVMAIEDEYRPKLRAIRTDSSLSDNDKKTKMKALTEEKRGKVEAAVGKEIAEKVEAFYSGLKKNGDEKKGGTGGNKQKVDD
jgi:hypothetical protein